MLGIPMGGRTATIRNGSETCSSPCSPPSGTGVMTESVSGPRLPGATSSAQPPSGLFANSHGWTQPVESHVKGTSKKTGWTYETVVSGSGGFRTCTSTLTFSWWNPAANRPRATSSVSGLQARLTQFRCHSTTAWRPPSESLVSEIRSVHGGQPFKVIRRNRESPGQRRSGTTSNLVRFRTSESSGGGGGGTESHTWIAYVYWRLRVSPERLSGQERTFCTSTKNPVPAVIGGSVRLAENGTWTAGQATPQVSALNSAASTVKGAPTGSSWKPTKEKQGLGSVPEIVTGNGWPAHTRGGHVSHGAVPMTTCSIRPSAVVSGAAGAPSRANAVPAMTNATAAAMFVKAGGDTARRRSERHVGVFMRCLLA